MEDKAEPCRYPSLIIRNYIQDLVAESFRDYRVHHHTLIVASTYNHAHLLKCKLQTLSMVTNL